MIKILQEGWAALKDDLFEKLTVSMEKRIEAMIKTKGWYTKY
jgi:hypothetical protein